MIHRSVVAIAVTLALLVAVTMLEPAGASTVSGPSFGGSAPNAWSAVLTWTTVPGTQTIQILRNGREIDRIPATATTYRDQLLWERTTYSYEAKFLDAGGAVVEDANTQVTTPKLTGFPRLYSDSSFWNTRIGKRAKTDPNSPGIIASSIVPTASVATLNNNDVWGVPLAMADPASKVYAVGCTRYGCDVHVDFPIPRYARPNTGGDGKLVVEAPWLDMELDMGRAVYDQGGDTWTTGSRYPIASDGWGAMCAKYETCNGVLMSGLDQFGGIIRPEEILQGHIDHALALVVPYWRSDFWACPAVKSSGGVGDPMAIPLGARVQLRKSFDVGSQNWPAWQKVIAVALQRYGAYVWDAGTDRIGLMAESNLDRGYDAWKLVGVDASKPGSASLNVIPWNLVRVLKIHRCGP